MVGRAAGGSGLPPVGRAEGRRRRRPSVLIGSGDAICARAARGIEQGPSLWAPLAYLAGLDVEHDPGERYAAFRRAELLLATGGDPRRPVELSDRAVETVAADLATPRRRVQLVANLAELEPPAAGPTRGERGAAAARIGSRARLARLRVGAPRRARCRRARCGESESRRPRRDADRARSRCRR